MALQGWRHFIDLQYTHISTKMSKAFGIYISLYFDFIVKLMRIIVTRKTKIQSFVFNKLKNFIKKGNPYKYFILKHGLMKILFIIFLLEN
jgi:hypothetical protein